MNSLRDIWYGNYQPQELSEDDKIKANELADVVNFNYEILKERLSTENKKLLNEYLSSLDIYNCFLEEKAFESGFQLASELLKGLS